ncbi:hypothetical protein [Blastopirellula retiformator]|uniref:Carboxypeptidase regulatory-like domain-containing protein n=1 Tax=Blastopirellula retiformator TaxID=2527970 RepID=A0A5C5VLG1_9BACT|nr:hypothetical protein [Blastopirellula retiformator]TWT39358.1 hypothetical protein Enr8_10570 [Blastopirellula retiformator]
MIRSLSLACLTFSLLAMAGCGPTPVTGGATGRLTTGENPLAEMQVNVYRADGVDTPIGFGTTAADGSFELVQPAAAGPLMLEPGKYRFTVESIGSPVMLPKKYGSAASSPLEIDWQSGQAITLDIPGLKMPR